MNKASLLSFLNNWWRCFTASILAFLSEIGFLLWLRPASRRLFLPSGFCADLDTLFAMTFVFFSFLGVVGADSNFFFFTSATSALVDLAFSFFLFLFWGYFSGFIFSYSGFTKPSLVRSRVLPLRRCLTMRGPPFRSLLRVLWTF